MDPDRCHRSECAGGGTAAAAWLVCRVATRWFALPIGSIIEVLRLLPVEPIAGMPECVRGLSIIRGCPTAVIDSGRLLAGSQVQPDRLIVVAVGEGAVALTVEQVIGVRQIDPRSLQMLPPLLQTTESEAVDAIRSLDGELFLALNPVRLIPDHLFDALQQSISQEPAR